MSIGFDVSHQKVGLNRPGSCREAVRSFFPRGKFSDEDAGADFAGEDARAADFPSPPTPLPQGERGAGAAGGDARAAASKKIDHSKWRRISGITEAVEKTLTPKERKQGIARLVKRIQTFAVSSNDFSRSGGASREGKGTASATANGGTTEVVTTNGALFKFVLDEWDFELADWVSVSVEGNSVECLCAYLQITRAKLTTLTKELCGRSPQEIMDGFKVKRVKQMVLGRLREAARDLWGSPGELAACRAYAPDERSLAGFGGSKRKGSAYVMPDWYGKNLGEERARRKEELLAKLRRAADFEGLAVRFGFGTAARLKRACLNVLGRTPRELENLLAADVVYYYVAAEVKVLREIACREDGCAGVACARELYHDCDEKPTEPWGDLWSAMEFARAPWLAAMAKALE